MSAILASVFAVLLFACPRGHRAAYGAAMRRDFTTELRARPHLLARLAYAVRMYLDVLATGCVERTSVVRRDFVYAARCAARTPGFTFVVVGTLALAIGANTAVFSIVRGVVLQPLPYADAGRIVVLHATDAGRPSVLSLPDFAEIHRTTTAFGHIAAIVGYLEDHVLGGGGEPRSVSLVTVTPEYFSVFGVAPLYGRFFDASDARPGKQAIILSEHVWRTALHAAPDIVGSTLLLEETPYRVIGIAPDALAAPGVAAARYDAWRVVSEGESMQYFPRDTHTVIARVRAESSVEAARAEVRRAVSLLQRRRPRTDGALAIDVRTLLDDVVGDVRPTLYAILAAVAGVLAVACANVANLFLARANARERERSMRHALGASRGRIARQVLTETFGYVAAGGVLGVAVAYGVVGALAASHVRFVPRIEQVRVDAWALAFTLAVVVVTTFAVGLAPVVGFLGRDVSAAFRASGRSGDVRRTGHARVVLVVVEIACAIALVIAASLVTRSYAALTARPLGFVSDDTAIVGTVTIGAARYQRDDARAAFFARSAERVRALPGVVDASWAFEAPFTHVEIQQAFRIIGQPARSTSDVPVRLNPIGPDFFRALAIGVRSGRVFDDRDTLHARNVVVVDDAFVRTYLRGIAPLGARLRFGNAGTPDTTPTWTIVGVVHDVRESYALPAEPTVYEPIAQAPPYIASLVVKHAPGIDIAEPAAAVIRTLDPRLVRPEVTTLADLTSASAARTRLTMQTLLALAFVAFVLALAGVYAVVGFGVAQRTREFGIRMALGAPARRIIRGVVARAMCTALVGIAGGVVLAAFLVPALTITLYDVAPLDPATFAGVVALVALAAFAAALVPAWRITRVDPVVALRYD